jgi:hypothetical protein
VRLKALNVGRVPEAIFSLVKRMRNPREEWASLEETATLGAQLAGIPLPVARERIRSVMTQEEGPVPWQCRATQGTGEDQQWHQPVSGEHPKDASTIKVETSTYICRIVDYRPLPTGWALLQERTLRARIHWPSALHHLFPSADPRRRSGAEPSLPRGPKPKFDWPAFDDAGKAILERDGIPDRQARLEEAMTQWCAENWGEDNVPACSTIRKRVNMLIENYTLGLYSAAN